MKKEDYKKYYIQGSDHYLLPKEMFDELFDEMSLWRHDAEKYSEAIELIYDVVAGATVVEDNEELVQ